MCFGNAKYVPTLMGGISGFEVEQLLPPSPADDQNGTGYLVLTGIQVSYFVPDFEKVEN